MAVDKCPICGISENIPSPDHDHRANFRPSYEAFPGEYASIEAEARATAGAVEPPEHDDGAFGELGGYHDASSPLAGAAGAVEGADPMDALVKALYDDRCVQPPQTDHSEHVIASLLRQGFRIVGRATTPEAPAHRPIKRIRNRQAEERCIVDGEFWPCSAVTDRAPEAPASPLPLDVRSPGFREAVVKVFNAPGEDWGPARGYYGRHIDHFIDMLGVELASAAPSEPGEPQP